MEEEEGREGRRRGGRGGGRRGAKVTAEGEVTQITIVFGGVRKRGGRRRREGKLRKGGVTGGGRKEDYKGGRGMWGIKSVREEGEGKEEKEGRTEGGGGGGGEGRAGSFKKNYSIVSWRSLEGGGGGGGEGKGGGKFLYSVRCENEKIKGNMNLDQ